MFAPSYFGTGYFGPAYFGAGSSAPVVAQPYWGPSYFAGPYWGATYFPGGVVAPPIIVAATLPGAIVDRFAETAELDFVTGGLTYGLAGEAAGDCYATFFLISEQFGFNTGLGYWKRITYQFSLYGPAGDDAPERMKDAVAQAFGPGMTPLEFSGGTSFAAFPQTASVSPEEVDSDTSGRRLHCQHLDVAFSVNRSRG